MKSGLFKLKAKDFIKGLIVAVITGIITFLVDSLQAGSLIDLKRVGVASVIAALSYLLKNFLTNSKDEFATSEKT